MKRYILLGVALVVLALIGTRTWAEPEVEAEALAGNCATLYEHWSYKGNHRNVNDGAEVANVGNYWNDRVSSILVHHGCTLRVWEHVDYKGDSRIFTSNAQRLLWPWNDRISSYKCFC